MEDQLDDSVGGSDVEISRDSDWEWEKCRQTIHRVLNRVFSIEFVAFNQSFALGLHAVIRTNLMIEKACRVNLNYTSAVCDDIEHHAVESDKVQEEVNNLNLYFTFLSALPCILISLIIGPLSDHYGRKPVLLLPIVGSGVAVVVYLLNVYYWQSRADYILLSAIYSLFGGDTTFLIGMYSFLADITTTDTRTSRVAILDASYIVGYSFGNFLSAPVYESLDFYGTFGISLAIYCLNFSFIFFFLNESRKGNTGPAAEEGSDSSCSSQTVDIFRTVFGARTGYTRAVLLLLMTIMLLYVGCNAADVNYLFTRKMFNWNEAKYTQVTTGVMGMTVIGSLFVLPVLSYHLGFPDFVIGLLAATSMMAKTVSVAFSTTGTQYVIANCVGLLSPQTSSVIRSLLSKVVQESELGKVYTMLGCLEAAIPLAASPLLTEVYNNTLDTFPGAVFLTQAGFIAIDLVLFLLVAGLMRIDQYRYSQYEQL